MVTWLVAIIGGAVGMILLALVALLYLPVLDNRLGILTGRDLRAFRALMVGGSAVDLLIVERAGLVTWRASHRDLLSETDIEGTTSDGVRYCWTVSHRRPRPWLPPEKVYFTPTNRHAAMLIPELAPPGLRANWLSEQPYRPGAVYDEANPEEARRWFEPFLKKRFPDLFQPR